MSDTDVIQAQRHLVADVDKIIYENMFSMPYDVCCELSDAFDELGAEIENLQAENAKLRELVRDMWHDGMCECDERGACAECEYHFPDRMRELRVEVDE